MVGKQADFKGKSTQKLCIRVPHSLHEKIHNEAFQKKVSVNSLLLDILEEWKARKRRTLRR